MNEVQREKLEKRGFRLRETCSLCVHFEGGYRTTVSGRCKLTEPTEEQIQARIESGDGYGAWRWRRDQTAEVPRSGWCPSFSLDGRKWTHRKEWHPYIEASEGETPE